MLALGKKGIVFGVGLEGGVAKVVEI
jgi:hypothetical protein